MKEYLFLIRGGVRPELRQSPEKWQAHMQKWMEWMGGLSQQGKLVGAQPLNASGKIITSSKKVVTDGPFMEGKEMVGGYVICKAGNYDEAVGICKGCPALDLEDSIVEIREIDEVTM